MWTVYLVECSDGSIYTGITTNLSRRLSQHNRGAGARYTRGRGPVHLVYAEAGYDKGGALRREASIKRLSKQAKRRLYE